MRKAAHLTQIGTVGKVNSRIKLPIVIIAVTPYFVVRIHIIFRVGGLVNHLVSGSEDVQLTLRCHEKIIKYGV